MTVFWIVCALFVVGALLLILPPLWSPRAAQGVGTGGTGTAALAVHRDQWREAEQDLAAGLIDADGLSEARREIQRRALEDAGTAEGDASAAPDRRLALGLLLAVPLASVVVYLLLGRPDAAAPQLAVVAPAARHGVTPEQIQQRAAALAERLKAQPEDPEGWLMLARSYTTLSRWRDAATAMRRAVELLPPNANLLADLADLTAMSQGRRLAGEPARLVQQALDVDPRHTKALALAGSVAFEARDYPAARGYWERLVELLPPDSPQLRSVRGSLAEAARLEGAPLVQAAASAPPQADGAPPSITGEVRLSPELAGQVPAEATLFVFARATEGPRMPLAIQREAAGGRTRFAFALDDRMAMTPTLKLSAFPRVVIGARISRSGNATPQSGDWVGQSEPVTPGAKGLVIVIDRIQP